MKKSITITSAIPEEYWEIARKEGWKWQEIFIAGIKARQGNPEMLNRMADYEADNKRLVARVQMLATQLWQRDEETKEAKK